MSYWKVACASPNDSSSRFFGVQYASYEACGNATASAGYGYGWCCVFVDTRPEEAVLTSCSSPTKVMAGVAFNMVITIDGGRDARYYKIVFSGDYIGETAPFLVSEGPSTQQFLAGNIVFTTGGSKSITATLVKI